MWLDNWKKGLAYIAVAVPTFVELNVLAAVCGTSTPVSIYWALKPRFSTRSLSHQ